MVVHAYTHSRGTPSPYVPTSHVRMKIEIMLKYICTNTNVWKTIEVTLKTKLQIK